MDNSNRTKELKSTFQPSSPFGPTQFEKLAEEMHVGEILMRRWLASWIDLIALIILVLAPILLNDFVNLGEEIQKVAFFVCIVIVVVYFPLCESKWGRSLGKVVTGLIVVDENGNIPRLGRAITRNLLRLVEDNPLFMGGVPAGIFVLATKRKQRLGDLVAGTYVLRAQMVRQLLEPRALARPLAKQAYTSSDEAP